MRVARNPVVLMLGAALFINYVDRGILPTASTLIQSELRLSKSELGLLMSAFFWTYASAQIPVGWLAERIGAHRVLAVGLSLWAISTVLVGVTTAFWMLLILRLLLGLGESAAFPCTSKILAATVPTRSLGTANGIVAFGFLFGPAIGTYVGGHLMSRFGWRASFIAFGCASLLWLIPWFRLDVQRTRPAVPAAKCPRLGSIVRQRPLWGSALGHFSSNYTYYFLLSWLPFYLVKERGYSLADMATLAGTAYMIAGLSAMLGGRLIDGLIARGHSPTLVYKSALAASHTSAVICMVCMALGSRPLALGSLYLYQAMCGLGSSSVFAVAQIFAGPAAAGRWVGIQNSIANLSGVLAPAATGILIQKSGNFSSAFIGCAVVSTLGLLSWVFVLPRVRELDWAATD